MMSEINEVTVSLQSRSHSLANCRQDFYTLRGAMNDASDNLGAPYTIERLDHILSVTTLTMSQPDFESGVVKIQRKIVEELSREEKVAVRGPLKNNKMISSSSRLSNSSQVLTTRELLANRRRLEDTNI